MKAAAEPSNIPQLRCCPIYVCSVWLPSARCVSKPTAVIKQLYIYIYIYLRNKVCVYKLNMCEIFTVDMFPQFPSMFHHGLQTAAQTRRHSYTNMHGQFRTMTHGRFTNLIWILWGPLFRAPLIIRLHKEI